MSEGSENKGNLGGLFSGLLSNPAALSAILSMLGSAGSAKPASTGNTYDGEAVAIPASAPAPAPHTPDLSSLLGGGGIDKIGQLLANPEVMAMLPKIMSAIGSGQGQQKSAPDLSSLSSILTGKPADESPPEAAEAFAPIEAGRSLVPPSPPPKKYASHHRAALLHALKPYMSPERGEAIEYMIKILEVIDIISER